MDLMGLGFLALELCTSRTGKLTRVLGEESKAFRMPNGRTSDLPVITLDQLAWHDNAESCWVAIHDYIYDCTDFLKIHPGGADILAEYAGRDATLAFIGSGHTKMATALLDKYLIGELPFGERLFRKPGGVQIISTI